MSNFKNPVKKIRNKKIKKFGSVINSGAMRKKQGIFYHQKLASHNEGGEISQDKIVKLVRGVIVSEMKAVSGRYSRSIAKKESGTAGGLFSGEGSNFMDYSAREYSGNYGRRKDDFFSADGFGMSLRQIGSNFFKKFTQNLFNNFTFF